MVFLGLYFLGVVITGILLSAFSSDNARNEEPIMRAFVAGVWPLMLIVVIVAGFFWGLDRMGRALRRRVLKTTKESEQ